MDPQYYPVFVSVTVIVLIVGAFAVLLYYMMRSGEADFREEGGRSGREKREGQVAIALLLTFLLSIVMLFLGAVIRSHLPSMSEKQTLSAKHDL